MIRDRLARYGQNDAYERGWREGWAAALARIEELGLKVVVERERRLAAPVPMTLAFDTDPHSPEPDASDSHTDAQHPHA